MICAIYLLTALHPLGQDLWRLPIVSIFPGNYGFEAARWFDKTFGIRESLRLEKLPINVAFMLFGGVGTVGNIINR